MCKESNAAALEAESARTDFDVPSGERTDGGCWSPIDFAAIIGPLS